MPPFVRVQLDYYAVLEIDPSADVIEVNAAFRRLAWRYHPDRNPAPGATLQFQDINEAHQVLFDPELRAGPRMLVRAALPLMLCWKILEEAAAGGYRVAAVRRHPQFPLVDDIVAFNARFLEETLANAAYSEPTTE